jgi:hypothetical protein
MPRTYATTFVIGLNHVSSMTMEMHLRQQDSIMDDEGEQGYEPALMATGERLMRKPHK